MKSIKMNDMYDFSVLRELRKKAGLNIADVSERSGVSSSVISKLERNHTAAELETLYRLSRVFSLSTVDLISLAENRMAHRTSATSHVSDGFHFKEVDYNNVRCLYGTAKAGAKVSQPHRHSDDYELCWVVKGSLFFYLPKEKFKLKSGDAVQFDALLEHTYEALEDCEVMILHLRKEKRF